MLLKSSMLINMLINMLLMSSMLINMLINMLLMSSMLINIDSEESFDHGTVASDEHDSSDEQESIADEGDNGDDSDEDESCKKMMTMKPKKRSNMLWKGGNFSFKRPQVLWVMTN